MPLIRYFVVMGGVLLSLLLLADWYLPKPEATTAVADIDRSTIRLHSSQRWPEAVRIDTAAAPPARAAVEADAAEPPLQPAASEQHERPERPERHAKRAGRSITHSAGRRFANYQPRDVQSWVPMSW